MMTVPNRSLRLLSQDELAEFGLTGRNAAQEDLERVQLVRKCGLDFVRRKDAFQRAFEQQCPPDAGIDAMNACGAALLPDYKFPDEKCVADSPLAELEVAAKSDGRSAESAADKPEEHGKGKSQ